jgi:hypothetical protein
VLGAFNLYAAEPDGYDPDTLNRLRVFAGTAGGAVGIAVKQADQVRLSNDLRTALASRTVIDQALGIVMAQQRCTADQAFDILRRASQNRNVKLRAIAAGVVTSVTGQAPAGGPFSTDS